MDKENNIVYVQTKNGIFKCYKSEQMHKPIYYPIESKTNGYIDYNDVINILSSDDLYNELKKQKEVIDKVIELLNKYESIKAYYEYIDEDGYDEYNYDEDFKKELLDILKKVIK